MATQDELIRFKDAAVEASHAAAEVLAHWQDRFSVAEKGKFDLVTDADVASQKTIFSFLSERFPDHAFLGEEGDGNKKSLRENHPPTWIVDPIDGTTNYVHGYPFYCISIGLQIEGELVVGVIYDPSHNDLFWAAKGLGAYLHDQRLKVSQVSELSQSLLGTGFPPDISESRKTFQIWEYLSTKAQSIRRTGSTALNLAYLAAGRFDCYFGFDNHVWDVAAGVVLVQEAGGRMSTSTGAPYDPFQPDTVASNGLTHDALLQELQRFQ